MVITTKVDLTYNPNVLIPAGTDARILTSGLYRKLTKLEKAEIFRMRRRNDEIGRKGVFALLEGKYRWVEESDYE